MKSIRSFTLAAVTALACALSGNALAGKPEKVYYGGVFSEFLIAECDGFDVLSDATFDGFFLLKTDKDGNVISVRDHTAYVDDVWYNSTNPDIRINAGPVEVENRSFDLLGDPPTFAVTGVALKATIPGYGVVFLQAGFLLVDLNAGEAILNRGPSDLVDGNSELLCSLLAS